MKYAFVILLMTSCTVARVSEPAGPRPAEAGSSTATLAPDEFDAAVAVSVDEAQKKAGDGAHAHEEAVVYTCPMHPEIRSPKPGDCPKCGMTLVKVKP